MRHLRKTVKYIKLILILLFFGSCSTNKSTIGLYGKCGKSYWACTQIELKADNTFEYFIYMDVGGGSVLKGTWKKVSNDTIILNTYKQPVNPKTTYVGKINPELNGKLKIRILDNNGSLGFSNVFINNRKQFKATDSSGVAEFDAQFLKNIEYGFLGQQETIEIDNPNYNEIDILIKDLNVSAVPQFLTDYKIAFNQNKIIMDSSYVYKRTNLKNKQWK